MGKIAFFGDVFCEGTINGSVWPADLGCDYCVFNFEGVSDNGELTNRDAAPQKTNLKGRGNPFDLTFKKYYATLANNHALDYTDRGCAATLRFLSENGVQQIGLKGPGIQQRFLFLPDRISISAYMYAKIKYTKLNGCAYSVEEMDVDRIVGDACEAHEAGSRFHVVSLHWGTELLGCPWPNQVEFAHRLIDSGVVDLVIGMHPHCIQNVERYKGKLIFYSLGNAFFSDFTQPSAFEDGVPNKVFGCAWGPESKKSIVTILDTATLRVSSALVKFNCDGWSVFQKSIRVDDAPPQVRKNDAYVAVWRRFVTGIRMLLKGDVVTSRFHFKAAVVSCKSYMRTFQKMRVEGKLWN